jgi:hypothetical protein
MTPDSAPEDVQATWLDPAIMGPPVALLASRAADGVTDQRIVATEFADRLGVQRHFVMSGPGSYARLKVAVLAHLPAAAC